jgi:DNA polymerase
VIKCRPPGNRNPRREEIQNCQSYLERQIEVLRPRMIVALGLTAAHWLTGTRSPLGHLRNSRHHYRHIPVVCTYHPAYARRNPAAEPKLRRDLRSVLREDLDT